MLKRSPRSRVITIALSIFSVIAFLVISDSLLTMRALAKGHGKRVGYVITSQSISRGDKIESSRLKVHELFSGDAPAGALTKDDLSSGRYATSDIPEETILTKNMVAKTSAATIDSDKRMIFIPTHEKIPQGATRKTDLISVTDEGYGAAYVASGARILFALSETTDDDNSGYWVEVSEEEASDIAEALSNGEVRFALTH